MPGATPFAGDFAIFCEGGLERPLSLPKASPALRCRDWRHLGKMKPCVRITVLLSLGRYGDRISCYGCGSLARLGRRNLKLRDVRLTRGAWHSLGRNQRKQVPRPVHWAEPTAYLRPGSRVAPGMQGFQFGVSYSSMAAPGGKRFLVHLAEAYCGWPFRHATKWYRSRPPLTPPIPRRV